MKNKRLDLQTLKTFIKQDVYQARSYTIILMPAAIHLKTLTFSKDCYVTSKHQ